MFTHDGSELHFVFKFVELLIEEYTIQRMHHSECLGLKPIRVLHLPGGCGGGRAVRRSKRSEDIIIGDLTWN